MLTISPHFCHKTLPAWWPASPLWGSDHLCWLPFCTDGLFAQHGLWDPWRAQVTLLLTPGSGCCSLSPLPPPTPIAWMPMLLIFSDSFGAKFLEKKGREGRGGERNGGEKMRRNGKRDLIFLLQSSSFFLSYLFAIALITSYRHFKICISKTVPIFSLIKTPLYSSILLMGL